MQKENEAHESTVLPNGEEMDSLGVQELRERGFFALLNASLKRERADRRWTTFKRMFWGAVMLLGALLYIAFYAGMWGYKPMPTKETIGVLKIEGPIATGGPASADGVIPVLNKLFQSKSIPAIVLYINSGGGSPSEAERITSFIDRMREETNKPVYAACGGVCASAAYMIAAHADEIYVGKYSWAGSIGVILKGWDLSKVMEKMDVDQRVFASHARKDILNPYKEISEDNKNVLQGIVDDAAMTFKKEILARRQNISTEVDVFTGEVWNGNEAMALGLVDGVYTLEDVLNEKYPGIPSRTFTPKVRKNSFLGSLGAGIGHGFADRGVELIMEMGRAYDGIHQN